MLAGNKFDRFAVEPLLLQKLTQRGSDAVMVADGVGAYARVAAVWIFRETNPVFRRQRKASQLGSSPSQVLPRLSRCDPARSFCRKKKDFPLAQEREGLGCREERGHGFSKSSRSLDEKMAAVSDGTVNAARQFPLTASESLKGELELFEGGIAERNPVRFELQPLEPGAEGAFKKLLQLGTSKLEGQERFAVCFQVQISQMQLDLRPIALASKNRGVDFELSQMQRVSGAIPKSIDAFDLLDYRRGMGCAQTIDPTRKSEVHTSANGFPLHRHLGLVVASPSVLNTAVGPPALECAVRCPERAGSCEAARAMHKGHKFSNGSLEHDWNHESANSPKIR